MKSTDIKYIALVLAVLACLYKCVDGLWSDSETKTGNSSNYKSKSVKEDIIKFNRKGPFLTNDSTALISNCDIENGFLVLYVEYMDFNISVFKENKETTKALLYLNSICMDPKQRDILDNYIENNNLRGLKYVMIDNKKNVVTCELSKEYIHKMDMEQNSKAYSEKLYNALVLQTKFEAYESVKLHGHNLIIYLQLDENSDEYKYCKSNKSSIGVELLDMEDISIKKVVIMCSVTGCNIIYKIRGINTGTSFEIKITNKELQRLVKNNK